ncbi:hypothetical protein [Inhella proteolytica]|uniref:Thioredoxin domain-containing protein n=1 Tax=Inhella proteolytica TaxID=2795029 RepID=A0A931J123_9BURK|nr:hypothetical protein [Inhella proteolytica]MBH9577554.1 hypothetical protein [Inhella proteolytica]
MRKALFLALALALPTLPCSAAEEAFGPQTFQQLQQQVQAPTWLVFSATYCGNCPAVVAGLRRQHAGMPLWLVLTDDGEETHPLPAERRWRFEGHELALRHAVNPQWKGITPYLALLRPGQAPLFALGQPSNAQLQALEKARGKPASK